MSRLRHPSTLQLPADHGPQPAAASRSHRFSAGDPHLVPRVKRYSVKSRVGHSHAHPGHWKSRKNLLWTTVVPRRSCSAQTAISNHRLDVFLNGRCSFVTYTLAVQCAIYLNIVDGAGLGAQGLIPCRLGLRWFSMQTDATGIISAVKSSAARREPLS